MKMDIIKTLDLLYKVEDYLEYDETKLGLEVGLFINELQKELITYKNKNRKILVNNKQEEINFNKHVKTIIEIAKHKANYGISIFYYPIPRGQNISHWNLIDKVEEKTENIVYAGYKCIQDGLIKFSIRTN